MSDREIYSYRDSLADLVALLKNGQRGIDEGSGDWVVKDYSGVSHAMLRYKHWSGSAWVYDPITLGQITLSGVTANRILTTNGSSVITAATLNDIGAQPVDGDLTAISALTGTGVAVRSADNTWLLRTISVMGNGIAAMNGNGVAGDPTIYLDIGTSSTQVAAGNHNHGTGTVNYLTKWSNTTGGLASSLLFDSGSSVGLGTTSPSSLLHLNSTSSLWLSLENDTVGTNLFQIGLTSAGKASFRSNHSGFDFLGIPYLGQAEVPMFSVSANNIVLGYSGYPTYSRTDFYGTVAVPGLYFDQGNLGRAFMWWDNPNRCISITYDGDTTLQVGLEEYRYIRNAQGSVLNNGSAVKVVGSTGNKVDVQLVGASDSDSIKYTGITTEAISVNGTGFINTRGEVRDFNTSAWAEGTTLYLSTTPGQFSNVPPAKGNRPIIVGTVTKSATLGTISQNVTKFPFLHELGDVDTTGVVSGSSLAYNGSTWVKATFQPLITGLSSSRVLVTDASQAITSSSVTTTELGYLSGVTSAIQTQLNGKVSTWGLGLSGRIPYFYSGTQLANSLLYCSSRGIRFNQEPSNWGSSYSAMELGVNAIWGYTNIVDGYPLYISNNRYNDGTGDRPHVNGGSMTYALYNRTHRWYIDSDLTAGVAFTPTLRMTLSTSGLTLHYLSPSTVLVSDANKTITSSSVTSTELSYVSGVTSAIQTQLNGKLGLGGWTASRALMTSPSGNILESAVTSTELGYLSGVTSAIQTQLAAKVSAGVLVANRALTTDASNNAESSSVTTTELGYLSGVTSAIQTQLDGKLTPYGLGLAGRIPYFYSSNSLANSLLYCSSRGIRFKQAPSEWGSSYSAMELGVNAIWGYTNIVDGYPLYISNNRYNDGSGDKPYVSGGSMTYALTNRTFRWYINSGLTAGVAFTPTQVMVLGTSGLRISTLAASSVVVNNSSGYLESSSVTPTELSYLSGKNSVIDGSGTIGYIPMFSGANRLTNSAMYTSGITTATNGRHQILYNCPDTQYNNTNLELVCSYASGSKPSIGFHRSGKDAMTLLYAGGRTLQVRDDSNATLDTILTTGNFANRTNWPGNSIDYVVGQLAWKNYDIGHTIFDASQSTSPSETAVNNSNSQFAWIPTYPTLMGWNGSETYGVRVDSARQADNSGLFTTDGITTFLATNATVSNYNDGLRIGRSPAGYSLIALGANGFSSTGAGQWTWYTSLLSDNYKLYWDYAGTNMMTLTTGGDLWLKTAGGDGITLWGSQGYINSISATNGASSQLELQASGSSMRLQDGLILFAANMYCYNSLTVSENITAGIDMTVTRYLHSNNVRALDGSGMVTLSGYNASAAIIFINAFIGHQPYAINSGTQTINPQSGYIQLVFGTSSTYTLGSMPMLVNTRVIIANISGVTHTIVHNGTSSTLNSGSFREYIYNVYNGVGTWIAEW